MPEASTALQGQSSFTDRKGGGLYHEAGKRSCFNDYSVLSTASLLTRLPLASWVLTTSSFHLLDLTLHPASIQHFWLQYPKVISPVAKTSDKLVGFSSS